jgi:hypothetical protein
MSPHRLNNHHARRFAAGVLDDGARHRLGYKAGVPAIAEGRIARAMRCGQVSINAFGAGGGIELPFGGVKRSGHGREKGFEALYEFSASKTIVMNHG